MRRSRGQTASDASEGGDVYVSMTDMMVGVLFIFIILLGWFALQFRSQSAALLRADDPPTAALLQTATALQPVTERLRIDRVHRVICVPGAALGVQGEERCFSYAEPTRTKIERTADALLAERADLTRALVETVAAPEDLAIAAEADGLMTFNADRIFAPGSAALSAEGAGVVTRVAAQLARTLPCLGWLDGFDARGCAHRDERLWAVNVLSRVDVDAFTEGGQEATTLALRRSAAFHRALTTAQPTLSQIRTAPPEWDASQPMLKLSSVAQSAVGGDEGKFPRTIGVQFEMQW